MCGASSSSSSKCETSCQVALPSSPCACAGWLARGKFNSYSDVMYENRVQGSQLNSSPRLGSQLSNLSRLLWCLALPLCLSPSPGPGDKPVPVAGALQGFAVSTDHGAVNQQPSLTAGRYMDRSLEQTVNHTRIPHCPINQWDDLLFTDRL